MQSTGRGGGSRDDTSTFCKYAKWACSAFLIAPIVPQHALIKAQELFSDKVINCWGTKENGGSVGDCTGVLTSLCYAEGEEE